MCGTCSSWRWSPLPPSRRSPPDAARPQASWPPDLPGPGAGAGLTRRHEHLVRPVRRFWALLRVVRADAEQLHRVPDLGEPVFPGHLLGPLLHRATFDINAAATLTAGQVVVVTAGTALPVERLAVVVPDRVDAAFLAEDLQVAVDGGEPDVLAAAPQLGVDLLGTAEPGQPVQRRHQRGRLPRPADLGPARPVGVLRGGRGVVRLRGGHNRTLPGRFDRAK